MGRTRSADGDMGDDDDIVIRVMEAVADERVIKLLQKALYPKPLMDKFTEMNTRIDGSAHGQRQRYRRPTEEGRGAGGERRPSRAVFAQIEPTVQRVQGNRRRGNRKHRRPDHLVGERRDEVVTPTAGPRHR